MELGRSVRRLAGNGRHLRLLRRCDRPRIPLHRTKYGDLFASWRFADGAVRYEYEIPAGMRAHILLPDGREEFVCGGKHLFFTKDRI